MTGLDAHLRVSRGDFTLDLPLAVSAGQTVALIGPNGAGKSTALLALAGFVPLVSGGVTLGGRPADPRPERRRVGLMLPQPMLFPHLTVRENIAFGPRAHGRARVDSRRVADEWITRTGLVGFDSRRPGQLSGGQAQRVALARALAVDPELLLLDEPLAALDVNSRDAVRAELATHVRAFAGVCIVVAHDYDDVAALADEVIVLDQGRAVQRGSLGQLAAEPATDFVRRFTSA